jgi:hypothetical protein
MLNRVLWFSLLKMNASKMQWEMWLSLTRNNESVFVNLTSLWKGCRHCKKRPLFIYPVSDLKGRFPMEASEYNSSHTVLWRNGTAGGMYTWSAEATKTVSSYPQSFYLSAIISGNLFGESGDTNFIHAENYYGANLCFSKTTSKLLKKYLYLNFVKACSTP